MIDRADNKPGRPRGKGRGTSAADPGRTALVDEHGRPPATHHLAVETGGNERRRLRLVVAVFDEVAMLAESVRELIAQGHAHEQVCVLCSGSQLAQFADAGPGLDWLATHAERTSLPGGHMLIAASHDLAGVAALLSSSGDAGPNGETLPPLVHRVELHHHLARNAILLLVDAGSLDRQQTCTRLLMRRTRHAVQTHQVAWRSAGRG